MLKFLKNLPDFSRLKIITLAILTHFVLFALPINIKTLTYSDLELVLIVKNFILDICLDLLFACIIISALTINKIVFSIFFPLFFIFSGVCSYFMFIYRIDINPEMIAAVLTADKEQIYSHLYLGPILFFIANLMISLFFVYLICYKNKKLTLFKAVNFYGIIFFALYIFIISLMDTVNSSKHLLFNYLSATYNYTYSYHKNPKTYEKENIAEKYKFIEKTKQKNMNVVLVIGESARSDRFGINYYRRNTTPRLSEQKNLISFKNAYSCAAMTMPSISCMLTRASKNNKIPIYSETSIISVFKSLGFRTYWIAMPSKKSFNKKLFYKLMTNSDEYFLLNKFIREKKEEVAVVEFLDKILKDKTYSKKFIIIHTMGSHWPYIRSTNSKFLKYKPYCKIVNYRKKFLDDASVFDHVKTIKNHCDKENLNNSYDNSILYTDYFLDEILKSLKSYANSLFFYTSDHGQSLGENGYYMQGKTYIKEQVHVPFLFWASDNFINFNKKKIAKIKKKTNDTITHEYLFHSLLDCLDIESKAINKQKSICND